MEMFEIIKIIIIKKFDTFPVKGEIPLHKINQGKTLKFLSNSVSTNKNYMKGFLIFCLNLSGKSSNLASNLLTKS